MALQMSEMESIFKHGSFTSDVKSIESSVYQMSLTGGVFGLAHETVSKFAQSGPVEVVDSAATGAGSAESQLSMKEESVRGEAFDKTSNPVVKSEKEHAVEKLSDLFGSDSPTLQRLLELDHNREISAKILSLVGEEPVAFENKSYLPGLAQFIASNVDEHKSLVERIADGAKLSNAIAPERVSALAELNKRLAQILL